MDRTPDNAAEPATKEPVTKKPILDPAEEKAASVEVAETEMVKEIRGMANFLEKHAEEKSNKNRAEAIKHLRSAAVFVSQI